MATHPAHVLLDPVVSRACVNYLRLTQITHARETSAPGASIIYTRAIWLADRAPHLSPRDERLVLRLPHDLPHFGNERGHR